MEERSWAVDLLTEAVERWSFVRQQVRSLVEPFGLDVDVALGLFSAIAVAEGEYPIDSIRAVDRLVILHGIPIELIAQVTGLPEARVKELASQGKRSPKARDVLRLHFEGLTVNEIVAQTGTSKALVYRWLDDAGQQPNRHRRAYPPTMRRRAVDLYRNGHTYSQIAAELRVPYGHVANLLRSAHRHGEFPEYGSRKRGA